VGGHGWSRPYRAAATVFLRLRAVASASEPGNRARRSLRNCSLTTPGGGGGRAASCWSLLSVSAAAPAHASARRASNDAAVAAGFDRGQSSVPRADLHGSKGQVFLPFGPNGQSPSMSE
jgi:hypothetical protein